jgi:hypothetical protein
VRRLALGLAIAVAGAAIVWTTQSAEVEDVPVVQLPVAEPPPVRRVTRPSGPLPVPASESPPEERPVQKEFRAVAAAVARSCGLDPRVACEGDACVALAEAPDLDRATGWARMVLAHPRFVASTALRDLGVPATALPCGDAIAQLARLTGSPDVGLVERTDGSEVWCAGPPAVCDAAAAALGLDAIGFDQPDARKLTFDRGDTPFR